MFKEYRELDAASRLYAYMRWKICPFDYIEPYVPKNGLIVDIGCGYGVFAHYLAVKSLKRKVIGIDISHKRIKQARRLNNKLSNLWFICRSAGSYSIPNCRTITLIDLLHHIPCRHEQYGLLKKCFDSLDSNGYLIIKDIDLKPLWKFYWNYVHDWLISRGKPTRYMGRNELISHLLNMGFMIERVDSLRGYPYPHILCVARKI